MTEQSEKLTFGNFNRAEEIKDEQIDGIERKTSTVCKMAMTVIEAFCEDNEILSLEKFEITREGSE